MKLPCCVSTSRATPRKVGFRLTGCCVPLWGSQIDAHDSLYARSCRHGCARRICSRCFERRSPNHDGCAAHTANPARSRTSNRDDACSGSVDNGCETRRGSRECRCERRNADASRYGSHTFNAGRSDSGFERAIRLGCAGSPRSSSRANQHRNTRCAASCSCSGNDSHAFSDAARASCCCTARSGGRSSRCRGADLARHFRQHVEVRQG